MDEHSPSAFGEVINIQRYDVPVGSIAKKPRVWGKLRGSNDKVK